MDSISQICFQEEILSEPGSISFPFSWRFLLTLHHLPGLLCDIDLNVFIYIYSEAAHQQPGLAAVRCQSVRRVGGDKGPGDQAGDQAGQAPL